VVRQFVARHYATFSAASSRINIRFNYTSVGDFSMLIARCLSYSCHLVPGLLATVLTIAVTGCSSSDSVSTTRISGSVFAAPVSGASCEIQRSNGTTIVDSITSSATGSYSINIANENLADDLVLICNGGSYTDEADGSTQTAGSMAAYAAAGTLSSSTGLHATAESTIIYQLISQHGMTLADARDTFKAVFAYTPDSSIAPTDATSTDASASHDQLLAGLHAAAFSQLTSDLGLAPGQQFVLLAALAQDLSDGILDGKDISGTVYIDGKSTLPLPADIHNLFTIAMLNFRAGGRDATGLSNDKIGSLPFAKTALTSSYQVEYIAGMMPAMEGKTRFQIRVTDHNDLAVSTTVSLMPMMHMADSNHSTPVEGSCVETGTAGTYDCTIYYLMASSMMEGTSMGYWDLKVMLGGMMGEAAYFYPSVMMAMGDTAKVRLRSTATNDMIMSMTGPVNRSYYLFKSSLTGMTGNHQFQIFITAMENMMSYPAVFPTTTLNAGDIAYEMTISSMNVDVSTDLATWISADGSSNNGYWTAGNISGLSNGSPGEIYLRLFINGIQYSTNTEPASGINAYGTFFVTPGAM
jgi:hypothetical protein